MVDDKTVQPVGRYAPSPTGRLHFGSLVAALASFLQARSRGGLWYVRMEDIDPSREVPGAASDVLGTLEACGLVWDGPVLYQSERTQAYREALDYLLAEGAAFPCGCTRREARTGPLGEEGPIYPGTCRSGLSEGREPRTVRLRVDAGEVRFYDGVFGPVTQNLARDVGDFVLRRADGYAAYQLAVVLDDAFQGVTEVVRGADLLTSTPRQRLLHSLLGLPQPDYWHVPLLVAADGHKLGKSSGARPVDAKRPVPALIEALRFLGQKPPLVLADGARDEVLAWAISNWDVRFVPRAPSICVDGQRPPSVSGQ